MLNGLHTLSEEHDLERLEVEKLVGQLREAYERNKEASKGSGPALICGHDKGNPYTA